MQLFVVTFLLCITASETKNLERFVKEYLLDHSLFLVYEDDQIKTRDVLQNVLIINHPKVLVSLKELNRIAVAEKARNYMIIVNEMETINVILNKLQQSKKWNTKTKHLIVLTGEILNNQNAVVLFKLLWKYRVFNSVLMSINDKNNIAFTWFPYAEKSNCGSNVIPEQFDLNVTLYDPFLNKLPKKFPGCTLKAIWINNTNVLFVRNPFNKHNPGVLIQNLRAVSELMNFTIAYDKDVDVDLEEALHEANYTKFFEKVNREHIDIVAKLFVYAVYPLIGEDVLVLSTPLLHFTGYWLTSFSKPLTMWNALFQTLQIREYMLLLITYFSVICIWHFGRTNSINHRQSVIPKAIWDVTYLFLQGDINTTRITKTKYVLLIVVMWLTFNMTNIYNSRLISLVTTPAFGPKPKTLEEVVELGYRFMYGRYVYKTSRIKNPRLWDRIEANRIEGPEDHLLEILEKLPTDVSYTLETHNFDMARIQNKEKLQILQEKVGISLLYFILKYLTLKMFYTADRITSKVYDEKGFAFC